MTSLVCPGRSIRARTIAVICVASLGVLLAEAFADAETASGHRSGCHAAHSCPSDTGSYVCGDTGNFTYCGGSGGSTTTPTTDPTVPSVPSGSTPPHPSDPATDKDCGNFGSQSEAQAYFAAKGGPVSDPDRLDADNDGVACETSSGGTDDPPSSTSCEIRSAHTTDPADTPGSHYDVVIADALFERCIGRLTLTATFNGPLPAPPLPAFDYIVWWLGAEPCSLPTNASVSASVNFMNPPVFNVRPTSEYTNITPAVSADRRQLTVAFSSPALVGADLRCASLSSSMSEIFNAASAYDSVPTFWFEGFGPRSQRPATPTIPLAEGKQCFDGTDNDKDGRIDNADVGCADGRDDSEQLEAAPTLSGPQARRYARSALKARFGVAYRTSARVSCSRLSRIRHRCLARWSRPSRDRYSGLIHVWHVQRGDVAEWDFSMNIGRRDLRCGATSKRCLRRIVVG